MKREFSLVLNTAPHRGGIVPTVLDADAFEACFLYGDSGNRTLSNFIDVYFSVSQF